MNTSTKPKNVFPVVISIIVLLFLITPSCSFFSSEEDNSLQETSDQLRIEQTLNAYSAETLQANQTQDSYQSTLNAMQATNDAQSTALASTDTPITEPTLEPVVETVTSEPTLAPPTVSQDICHVILVNNVPKILYVTLIGPQPKTFQVQANSTYEFDIEPGEYEFNIEAQKFNPAHGIIEFPPGDFT
jgi:CBS domain containing-hemolysin-like protein